METNTPKHFVLQLGSLASLYLSLSFILVLLFGLINVAFPDAAEGYWALESAASSVRLGIAMTIVFFPTYLIVTRTVNKIRRQETSGTYLTLTKWLIYLSLLIGGGVLLGDLVAVVMAFLEGEISERFILKALSVLVVVGAAFYYYILDARGHWLENEKRSVIYGSIASLLVLTILVAGFMHIETPREVRERKLDDKQLTDLQDIQWHIVSYLETNDALPDTIADAYTDGVALPTAPEARDEYTYEQTEAGFALCAEFSHPSQSDTFARPYLPSEKGMLVENMDNWEHGAGEVCFERTINLPPLDVRSQ